MKTLLYIYGIMSLVTLIAYAIDKNAAVRGKWRIQEMTLHARCGISVTSGCEALKGIA